MRLGLTGSFGSGKSTVARFIRQEGIPVIDADEIAHRVTRKGSEGLRKIIKEFGEEYLTAQGELDRKRLASVVFSSPQALKKLEAIVHPLVRQEELALLEKYKNEPLVVLCVPLLFEKGMDTYVDKVAVVIVDEEERYRRLNQRYGYTVEQIKERLNAQMPQEEKIRRADFVIDNSGSLAETQKQVKELIKKCKNSVTEHL